MPAFIGPASDKKRAAEMDAQDDFHTLKRAHEVTSDKKRHRAAKKHGLKQLSMIKKMIGSK